MEVKLLRKEVDKALDVNTNPWRQAIAFFALLHHGGHYLDWGYWYFKKEKQNFDAKLLRSDPFPTLYLKDLIDWLKPRLQATTE